MSVIQKNGVIALYKKIGNINLILIGMIIGIAFGALFPEQALSSKVLGDLFIKGLRSVAPILIFILAVSAMAHNERGGSSSKSIQKIIILYLLGTFLAAFFAVIISFIFPTELNLMVPKNTGYTPPEGIGVVLSTVLGKAIDNPIRALLDANFIGLLVWGVGLGIALNKAAPTTKRMIDDLSDGVLYIVRWVIAFAPIGIFGLISSTIAEHGLESLAQYIRILAVLLLGMAALAFVINPLIVYSQIKRNPYPLVFWSLKVSGIPAFFTRSSAANVPVNLEACRMKGLDESIYPISIPLGTTINMGGAAVTITILTLAAAYTVGVQVSIFSALLLSIVATICACGASGIAGGSLLLIPLACSLFGISDEVGMQVIAIGLAIGVLQDSTETALNSSTDLLFTAAVCIAAEDQKKKEAALPEVTEENAKEETIEDVNEEVDEESTLLAD